MFQFFKRLFPVLGLTMFITISVTAQSITQTVKEEIVDQESNTPLPGANVIVVESDPMLVSVADGKADKQTVLDIVLEESVTRANAIVVRDSIEKPTIDNQMALTSARVFTVEETKRYAGSFNDHAHLVSGYAFNEMPRDSRTLKAVSTLNHQFNPQHNLQTGYLKSTPNNFQKDLYIKDISLKSVAFRRAVIAPALFMAAGLSTLDADNDDNVEIQNERNRVIPNFRHRADDYLQHAPIVAVYGLNWLGIEGKNDFANRTAILIKAEMMVGILTFSLKRITAVPRPDTGQSTSFPSGHTAQAFAAATFMAREYGHKSIWYSIGAYTVATGVGTMRVMNNRHWMSDVLVGAGIGILSTNLAYLTHQYRWGKKNKVAQTTVIPSYDGQTGMVNIIHRIN